MFERYSIVKDLGYVEVINSVDLQICMTKKSMSEFDRVNPCFYMKVSYNEEVLSMYYIQQRSTGDQRYGEIFLIICPILEEDIVLVSEKLIKHLHYYHFIYYSSVNMIIRIY